VSRSGWLAQQDTLWDFASGDHAPQRDEQLAGKSNDHRRLARAPGAVGPVPEPLCQSTVLLKQQEAPGELNQTATCAGIACALLSEPGPLAVAVARTHGGAWLPQELLARRETLRCGQAHLHQQLERLIDAYLRSVIPLDEYERCRRDLERRVQALAGQEEQLRSDAARQQRLAGVATSVESFRARMQRGLTEATVEQRRQLVLLLIDRVVVTNAEVEIRYVLPTSPDSEHVRFCRLRKGCFDHPPPRQHLEAGSASSRRTISRVKSPKTILSISLPRSQAASVNRCFSHGECLRMR
jgi:hypothetical protein